MNHLPRLASKVSLFFKKTFPLFLFFFCILVAFLPRFGMYGVWDSYPSYLTMDGVPLLTNLDGYYYLNNSKELLAGTYSNVDSKRGFPTGTAMPTPAPLLSIMVAGISYLTGFSIDWVAPFVPIFLSMLLAIPLYLLGRHFGNPLCGYTAAILGITAQGYITRTTLGVLDTDCLNPAFVLAIIYTAMQFALTKSRKRYVYLALTIILYILFLWWWDTAQSIVSAFSLWPILVAVIFFYRVPRTERLTFAFTIALFVITVLYWLGIDKLSHLFSAIYTNFNYVIGHNNTEALFPNTSVSNGEQSRIALQTIAEETVSNIYLFALSCVGFLAMIIKRPKQSLFFLPILIVGALAHTSARFIIFLAPVTALGCAFFLSLLQNTFHKKWLVATASILIIIPHLYTTLTTPPLRSSFFSSNILSTMKNIRKKTPRNSVIYSWWDEGHPLIFWGERPTLADGMVHDSERTVYLAFPLACNNLRLGANFIQFMGTYGLPGIHSFLQQTQLPQQKGFLLMQKLLKNGPEAGLAILKQQLLNDDKHSYDPEKIIDFLFPPQKHPIYLFIDSHMVDLNVEKWIHWFGTWDTERFSGEKTIQPIMIYNIKQYFDNSNGTKTKSIHITANNGSFHAPDIFTDDVFFEQINFIGTKSTSSLKFKVPESASLNNNPFTKKAEKSISKSDYFTFSGTYNLDVFTENNTAALIDVRITDMLISRLFYHYDDEQKQSYFSLIDQSPGNAQLWRVKGDTVMMK